MEEKIGFPLNESKLNTLAVRVRGTKGGKRRLQYTPDIWPYNLDVAPSVPNCG